MEHKHNLKQEKDFQKLIGNLLRYGVWLSLAVALSGGIIYLTGHAQETVHYDTFTENDRSIFEVVADVLSGVSRADGVSVIFLGVLLLFLTPVLRMVLSLFSFIKEKDTKYVCITLLVMGIIGMSIALGFSH
ncbi:DUF1634 domain-containing protein [Flavobacterium sp. RNTU_13]|uniref:DUF1634 domain-containing protein n=1 Tax=Flavobacterium sp. RNTU_13 TaxID=3375145 RepID=UPI0039878B52